MATNTMVMYGMTLSLTNALPADVALGKVDYMEVVGFSDHKATADVWYRLLNLGLRVAAGAGARGRRGRRTCRP